MYPDNLPWWMQQPGMQQPGMTRSPYGPNPARPPQAQPIPNAVPGQAQQLAQPIPNATPGMARSLLDLYQPNPNDPREIARRRQQQMTQMGQMGLNMMGGQPLGGGQAGMMPMNLLNRGNY